MGVFECFLQHIYPPLKEDLVGRALFVWCEFEKISRDSIVLTLVVVHLVVCLYYETEFHVLINFRL